MYSGSQYSTHNNEITESLLFCLYNKTRVYITKTTEKIGKPQTVPTLCNLPNKQRAIMASGITAQLRLQQRLITRQSGHRKR